MKRALAVLLVIALILAGVALWIVTHPPSDRDQILRLLDQVKEGVETNDVPKVMSCISQDYRDRYDLRKRDLTQLAFSVLYQQKGRFTLSMQPPAIEINGTLARVDLAAVTISVAPKEGGASQMLYQGPIVAQLHKEDGDWRIVSADGWQETREFMP